MACLEQGQQTEHIREQTSDGAAAAMGALALGADAGQAAGAQANGLADQPAEPAAVADLGDPDLLEGGKQVTCHLLAACPLETSFLEEHTSQG